jgi:BirA family biotin operon repressor/biotin-[acetyl-CoA-carboxylase] ligase
MPAETTPPDTFDPEVMQNALGDSKFTGHFYHLVSTSSTNSLALEAAQSGLATGVWLADEQTAGRGRGGHRWHSTAGDGLYLSVLVRARLHGSDALKLSLAAGLAAKTAVQQITGLSVDLRWPNDLLVACPDGETRKFGGILTESSMSADGMLTYAVIGIGMNLHHAALPEDLRPIATSLRLAGAGTTPRDQLVPLLLRALERELYLLEAEARGTPEDDPILLRFEHASTWVRGLRVHVAEDAAEDDGYTGVTAGLNSHGLLLVRTGGNPAPGEPECNAIRTVRHGGVRRA